MLSNFNCKENLINSYLLFSISCFLCLSVSFNGSYKIAGIIILSSYFLLFIPSVRKRINIGKPATILISSFIIFFICQCIEIIIHNESKREIDPSSKLILFIPYLILLSTIRDFKTVIPISFAIGSTILGSIAIYETFLSNIHRANAGINAIQFGNLASAIGIITLFLSRVFDKDGSKSLVKTLIIGSGFMAIVASILSGSRGGWLIFPIAVAIWLFSGNTKTGRRNLITSVLAILLVLTLALALGGFDRLLMIKSELDTYMNGEHLTSIGQRLEMWRIAFSTFMEAPFLGAGKTNYLAYQAQQIAVDPKLQVLANYSQAHNGYLDAMARRGTLGLLALLMLLSTPIYLGYIILKNKKGKANYYAISLIMLGLSFSTFNLTQSSFNHNSGMIFFAVLMIILLTSALAENKKI